MEYSRALIPYTPPKSPLATRHYEQFSPFALFTMILMLIGFLFLSYLNIKGHIADEGFHAGMVDAFLRGEWDNLPGSVTTPPYFHALIAFMTHISGVEKKTLEAIRFSQMLLSIGAIPCFYFIAKQLRHSNCDIRTLLCVLLPTYLPLFNLVYTDPPSLTFTALMVLLTLKQRYWLAALTALLGLAVRQMTIIWACFCAVYVCLNYIEDEHGSISFKNIFGPLWENITNLFPKVAPFLIPAVAFLVFVFFNKGIVVGDREAHPTSFNLANLFCFFIASFVIFLPYQIEKATENFQLIKTHKWIWVAIPLYFIVYLALHKITHSYNKPSMDWWIHNQIIIISTTQPLLKALFFLPILSATLTYFSIARSSETPWKMYLLYFFGALSFVPLPLVELRYYLVTLILFILFKPKLSDTSEKATLIIFSCISLYIIYGISHRTLFI